MNYARSVLRALIATATIAAFLTFAGGGFGGVSQETPSPAASTDQFFAGNVTALSKHTVTVGRVVLGKISSIRTFQITPETRVEGNLRVRSKVTVRFVSKEDGDQALHIIVRTGQKK